MKRLILSVFCSGLALCGAVQGVSAALQLSDLKPGYYFYFRPGTKQRSTYYVPNPAKPLEDPFELTPQELPPEYIPLVESYDPMSGAAGGASVGGASGAGTGQNQNSNWFTNPPALSVPKPLANGGKFLKSFGKGAANTLGNGLKNLRNNLTRTGGGYYSQSSSGAGYQQSGYYSPSSGSYAGSYSGGGYAPSSGGAPMPALPPLGSQYGQMQPPTFAPMPPVPSPMAIPAMPRMPTIQPIGQLGGRSQQVIPMEPGDTAMPNIFGGYNIIHSNGAPMTTTMSNIFGGQNIYNGTGGMTTTMSNIFGGQNIYGPSGGMTTTMPNIFGGQNIYGSTGGFQMTTPNIFGGSSVFGNGGMQMNTMRGVGGGFMSFP